MILKATYQLCTLILFTSKSAHSKGVVLLKEWIELIFINYAINESNTDIFEKMQHIA